MNHLINNTALAKYLISPYSNDQTQTTATMRPQPKVQTKKPFKIETLAPIRNTMEHNREIDGCIAIIIPCFNEEIAIAKVVRECLQTFPSAVVFVFDNNSLDRTATNAQQAGAQVIHSPHQGKGHVIRHAFQIIDADFYVIVDGDDTYPMEEGRNLLNLVADEGYAMAIGTRFKKSTEGSFRRFHVFGNLFFSKTVSVLFHQKVTDMLSGFRVLSRELVDQLRIRSTGFEIETDLTLQTISKGFAIAESPVAYRPRPAGSHSKLNTCRDGFFILKFIFQIMRDYRPLPFFGTAAFTLFVLSLLSGFQPIADYLQYSYVYTVPRAILAASLMILSFVMIGVGLILDSQIRSFNDQLATIHGMLRRRRHPRSSLKKAS
jgi:glycosyltransferase involved in cell wall biosynthesis